MNTGRRKKEKKQQQQQQQQQQPPTFRRCLVSVEMVQCLRRKRQFNLLGGKGTHICITYPDSGEKEHIGICSICPTDLKRKCTSIKYCEKKEMMSPYKLDLASERRFCKCSQPPTWSS
ncbi:hypothetical protein F2P81_004494 [Scophthalmus maximus]|uniref:Uncharacterized protein n=1 Tax=Scophthalmus maximus TaxID=52904 RepID=A0A6A4T9R9_SCOMX|nr:hypothetical protein F2P81_004494 [Scophthalmus maximus]